LDRAKLSQGFAQMTMSSNPQMQAAGRAAIADVQQRRQQMAQAAINGAISDVQLQKQGLFPVQSPIPGIMDYRTGQFYPNYQLMQGRGPNIGGGAQQYAPPEQRAAPAPQQQPGGGGFAPQQPVIAQPPQAPPSPPIKTGAEPQKTPNKPQQPEAPTEDAINRFKRENPPPTPQEFLSAMPGSRTMPVMGPVGNREKETSTSSAALSSLATTRNEINTAYSALRDVAVWPICAAAACLADTSPTARRGCT
jgi:hypothetical protein